MSIIKLLEEDGYPAGAFLNGTLFVGGSALIVEICYIINALMFEVFFDFQSVFASTIGVTTFFSYLVYRVFHRSEYHYGQRLPVEEALDHLKKFSKTTMLFHAIISLFNERK